MIPTINVTPHSPALKYNNIFEDTLSQLQSIREKVVQMKNSSIHQMRDGISTYGLVNVAILSASLPDLTASVYNNDCMTNGFDEIFGCNYYLMWSSMKNKHRFVHPDRRKSWTAVDELNRGTGSTHKSISLSSLDSEEQETIRVAEQRRRSARNSAGGISTHSLNEAELTRDFERIANKQNISNEIANRVPLQKSISTSSIIAKEDMKTISRHLTDSEDEHQSLLRAHMKIKVYENVEKRRKRGSLFFRKKKDKSKIKSIGGQITACDICGTNISLDNLKDHQLECKIRKKNIKTENTYVSQDYFDGTNDNIGNFNDDTPLIKCEFLNELPVEAQDLQADPILGIELKELDSWSPGVSKEVLKSLKEAQIKKQEHIYEFIMTEKHHCQTLLVMQKIFVDSLERHFPNLDCSKMFPRLSELTDLHSNFLKQLRLKQREQPVVDSIADILLDFFSLDKAQHLRLAYGEFCANHRSALEQFKMYITSRDSNFSQWYKHCLGNPLLKKKGIPECILFVTQRLTKYPLLIEPLLKSARDDKIELEKLQRALRLVKELLVDVDACVAEKELQDRQIDICQRIDNKSFTIYKNKPFRKSDINIESGRCLKFEGIATLMQGRSKMQLVMIIVLTDCLCFLVENSAHNKYTFFTPEHKAGVVPLQKLLIREKAGTESRGIYIISSNPLYPEMYELKVQTPKDKNVWIQTIRQAVLDCPSSDIIDAGTLTAEEKLRIGFNKSEIIEKMRQKDIEQAILLEEKLILQMNLLEKDNKSYSNLEQQHVNPFASISAAQFLSTYGSYKDIHVGTDCDTTELWKKVSATVQEISQLAASVYTASTGQPVSRSVSSVGEKHSGAFSSPTLPKRAETFAGYDEKRTKNNYQDIGADQDKLAAVQLISPRLHELEEGKKVINKSTDNNNGTISHNELLNASPTMFSCNSNINASNKDNSHFALLQVNHNLQVLLCIISQQITTIQNLQLQLSLYRDNPKTTYTHNDQLEELRNLQDKLQEEKTTWSRQKQQMQLELEEKKSALDSMQERLKREEEDIKQQREQLYRKMEFLSNQGLLLSPSTPLMVTGSILQQQQQQQSTLTNKFNEHDKSECHMGDISLVSTLSTSSQNNNSIMEKVEKRKDRWRTASTMSKTPPVNLLSATNAPKVQLSNVKQKIPIKLSSLSSTPSTTHSSHTTSSKVDKSASFNSPASSTTVTQMFPFKLADKRPLMMTSQLVLHHSRTGSSPAIIQQPHSPIMTSKNNSNVPCTDSGPSTLTTTQRHSFGTVTAHKNSHPITLSGNDQNTLSNVHNPSVCCTSGLSNQTIATTTQNMHPKSEEEEIYF